jgi:hypothetical protein
MYCFAAFVLGGEISNDEFLILRLRNADQDT